MILLRAHQKKVLNAAVSRLTWRNERSTLNRVFDAIERTDGCSVRGYKRVLENALKSVNRAIAALDVLEAND